MKAIILQKQDNEELSHIADRELNGEMLQALNHTNFIKVNGKEFEMIEGRLDLDNCTLELLVIPSQEQR